MISAVFTIPLLTLERIPFYLVAIRSVDRTRYFNLKLFDYLIHTHLLALKVLR